ncbi:MAG: bifunctional diaminohydroxyphosphoribosylaminopyrimidine deaminase/5-amino-6-(5-phosphoribosylamino)uracil reductase RibD [Chitinophagales bacterium]|nr:bifunctional diaminohydroxyphosphoribosylaminopyrimidine deaminase/5-amino-6-(5-phosphoribosylamino)uracil reductase RibD [Chitinophagales bacterium]
MHRCFELAKLGESYVAPNPMVGAVLVYEDRIIGEGYHERYGEAHAEVNCLNSLSAENQQLIPLSTLYVSLEPCAHFGKTPPCADLIIQHKIPKVVISVQDNFHEVNGKGIERLRANNVEVITGVLEEEGKELIKHFLFFHQYKRPYVALKFAQTKDGYLGIKEQEVKISNEVSKRYVHQLRAAHQAILVGKKTVLSDNPELSVRHWKGKNPIRIILGNANDIPADFNIFNNTAATVFLSAEHKQPLSVSEILSQLYHKNIISVLVEGGADVLQQFIESNLWNEAHVITSSDDISRLSTVDCQPNYIKAPEIHGDITKTILLENDTIQLLKNTHDLSFT